MSQTAPKTNGANSDNTNTHVKNTQQKYICGSCGHRNTVELRQPIICHACGSRILYKARTKRLVQFEAV